MMVYQCWIYCILLVKALQNVWTLCYYYPYVLIALAPIYVCPVKIFKIPPSLRRDLNCE